MNPIIFTLLLGIGHTAGIGYNPTGQFIEARFKVKAIEARYSYDNTDKTTGGDGWNKSIDLRLTKKSIILGVELHNWSDGNWRKYSNSITVGYQTLPSLAVVSRINTDSQSLIFEGHYSRIYGEYKLIRYHLYRSPEVRYGYSVSVSARIW